MKNVLIPVDGSANSLRAVHYMIDHVREHGACNLHLLNVQPPIVSGTVLAFVSSDMIQEYYEDEARTALADARIALDKAGVMYQSGLRVGKIAEAIKAYAAEQQCDHIVMGSRGLGAAGSLMLGSVAPAAAYRPSPRRAGQPGPAREAGPARPGEAMISVPSNNEVDRLHAYWRASNYLCAGMLYLRDNVLLRRPLEPAHIKPRILGHWGTCPGLSFTLTHLNRLIREHDLT